MLEQLLLDTKQLRDADAAAMNMQLVTWRDKAAVDAAFDDARARAQASGLARTLAALGLSLGMRIDPNLLGALGRGGTK